MGFGYDIAKRGLDLAVAGGTLAATAPVSLGAAAAILLTMGRPSEASEVLEHLVSDEPIVLVTDYDMPEMSGIELAEHALDVDPDIKIILLTGRGDETTAQTALRMGFSDYIIKPPEPVAFARAVQRAFHQRAGERHHRAMVAWMKLELDRRQNAIRDVTLSTLAAFATMHPRCAVSLTNFLIIA